MGEIMRQDMVKANVEELTMVRLRPSGASRIEFAAVGRLRAKHAAG